jgi:D-beta-D-heptose 7-phosphate kinase/D-beta-D-heptose 1-phosphate adenosyltransferase
MRVVLCTGGFDPLHSGHIEYFKEAKKLGDILIVGINSDEWLAKKKSRPFMKFKDRQTIVRNLKMVDGTVEFNDSDGTAKNAIRKVRLNYPSDTIIFANGGDRTETNIPEMDIQDSDLEFVFGVGGTDKMNSSRWLLDDWKSPKTARPWGYYRILHNVDTHVKVKELTVEPKMCLSMQRHKKRAEFWFVAEGEATVYTVDPYNTDYDLMASPARHQHTWIEFNQWHMLCNETDQPLKIIEIQYGENCAEEDIERK